MRILVSSCLLGLPTRYDGGAKNVEWIANLQREHTLIPVCPEQLGGLPTPRIPSERTGERVVNRDGVDVTREYAAGAETAAAIAHISGAQLAILKARSPSCGKNSIYDGTFSHALTQRDGTATEKILEIGIPVFTEEEETRCMEWINRHM